MQTKLTLRIDDSVVVKAKRLAQKRGTSVSKIFSEYISAENDDLDLSDIGNVTASMIGVLRGADLESEKDEYHAHLEGKYL